MGGQRLARAGQKGRRGAMGLRSFEDGQSQPSWLQG
jgi:hypothetical protein